MKIDYYQCDRCGAQYADGQGTRIGLWTDRKMDAAGSMDDVIAYADLCLACERKLFHETIKILYDLNRQAYQAVSRKLAAWAKAS